MAARPMVPLGSPLARQQPMLAILFGVLSLVLAGGLAVVLPILAWARMARLERELRELRAQLHALEHRGLQGAPSRRPNRESRRHRRPRRRWSPSRRRRLGHVDARADTIGDRAAACPTAIAEGSTPGTTRSRRPLPRGQKAWKKRSADA